MGGSVSSRFRMPDSSLRDHGELFTECAMRAPLRTRKREGLRKSPPESPDDRQLPLQPSALYEPRVRLLIRDTASLRSSAAFSSAVAVGNRRDIVNRARATGREIVGG
jgi:hypothetical protein